MRSPKSLQYYVGVPLMEQFTEQFEVVVVGAGHAGCEAAMAAARMGLKTAVFTLNVDLIAQMSCNPAVGGIAKGHLVREVDALGGIMGEVTDAVGIQFRLLNTSRGPAVWSPRAQCDKQAYRLKMREVLESQSNLKIKQAEVADLIIEESSIGGSSSGNSVSVCHSEEHSDEESAFINASPPTTNGQRRLLGIRLRDGRTVGAQAVIITTGTFLNGLIHCAEQQYPAGRSGEPPAVLLGEALKQLGLRGCRLKTGTPPRLDGRTIDWSRFQLQPGDPDPTPFSFRTKRVANDAVRLLCRVGDIARHLRVMMSDALGAKAERRGIGIARLKLEAGPVDGAAIETRWGASLKPAAPQAELLQGFAQEDRSRFTRTSRRILLFTAVDKAV